MTSTVETYEDSAPPDDLHSQHSGRLGSLMLSFLFGAAAGAGLAVLLAPARGRDIRAQLAERTRQGRAQAGQKLERGRAALDRTRAHVKDQTRHFSRVLSEGRGAMADIRARGGQALETISQEVGGAVSDAKAAYRSARGDGKGTSVE